MEIKLRAHIKETGKVLEVKYIDFSKTPQTNSIIALVGDNRVIRKLKDVDLLQYTGLKDKNGKEIYEGDIVRAMRVDDYFTDDKPCAIIKAITITIHTEVSGYKQGGPDGSTRFTDIQIIGNIYENPELLTTNLSD